MCVQKEDAAGGLRLIRMIRASELVMVQNGHESE